MPKTATKKNTVTASCGFYILSCVEIQSPDLSVTLRICFFYIKYI